MDNYYIGSTRDENVLEIWGYTSRFTYSPGDRVALHVSTTAEKWDLEIGRDGSKYQPVMHESGLPGSHHDTPPVNQPGGTTFGVNGLMGIYAGLGRCAGTCEWVMGLTRQDGQMERITRNVLDRFGARE